MKNRKWLKVFVSILCMLALLISNLSPLSWGGKSIDKVQAADWDGLTELTWSDFGIACGSASNDKKTLSSGKDINNSLFNGDITMAAGSDIRYLGNADYTGLIIAVTDAGALKMSTAGGWANYLGYGLEFTADTFGLTTFANTKFNLKIAVTEYTTKSATFSVYVNDQIVGEPFSYTADSAMGTYLSLYTGTIVPEYVLHELTWSDFGIACGSASTDKKTLSSGKDINNSLFNGDVTMAAGSDIRYLGNADYAGLIIAVTDTGTLKLSTAATWADYLGYGLEFSADTFGLTTFANTKFNLKIAVTEYTTSSANVEVYVNDQIVGETFSIGSGTLGTYMSLYTGTIVPEYVLHELTWSDFGIACGSASNDKKMLSSGKGIDNSLFNGDITMQAGSDIRYLGNADYTGLIIAVTDAGALKLSTAGMWANYLGYGLEFSADTFGLTTFANTKFNLKIVVTEYTTSSANVEVYVNGKIVGEKFTLGEGTLGTYMSLYTGTIVPDKASAETELHELTWSDFNIPCGEVSTAKNQLSSGKDINNSLFNGDITMQAGSDIRYLGNADYTGLIIAVTDAGALKLSTAGMWSNYLGNGLEFSAGTFGLATFANTKFNLKIAVTEYTTSSAKVEVYVNDKIVGEKFTLGEGTMGTYMSLYTGIVEADYVLHELTWSDFGITCGSVSTEKKQLSSEKDINNSLFNGDVTMAAGSEIRYAGAADFTGLTIGVNASGNLTLGAAAMWSDELNGTQEFAAATFNMETFANTRFNLKIAVTEYTTQSAKFRVWVNDQLVREIFTIRCTDANYPLGTYMSLFSGTIEADYILHELTWSDFGIPCNGQQTSVNGQLASDKEINNSLFVGDVIMSADSEIRYAGAADFTGLVIGVNASGNLTLGAGGMWSNELGGTQEFTAATFNMETFANTRFNLKIATTEYSDQSANFRVWVNGQLVREIFTIRCTDANYPLGTYMSLFKGSIDPSYTNGTSVPMGLADLTWEDFGFTCIGQYTANPNGGVYGKNGTLTSGKEMNNTLFSGNITMQAGSEIRLIGAADYTGLVIGVNANGDLRLSKAAVQASYLASDRIFSAETFGLSSFANTKFNLKVAITDYSTASAKIGVWVNDQMVGDYFTLEGVANYPLGSYMTFYDGTIEPHSIIAKPTRLTNIHFGDWNAGIYGDNVLNNNELLGDVSHPNVDTLLNTSLKENVKFTGPGASMDGQYVFCWGGLKAEGKTWYGLRIDFVGDTMKLYKVNNDATSSSSDHFTLTADTLGIDNFSFYDREYLWQVDITQCGDNVLVWMYFDGILYGNAPIVIQNLASEMSDTLVFSPMPQVNGTPVERPAALGVTERTLSDLYHDLDVNAYVIPSGVITMQKKNIVDGVPTWDDMDVNGGDKITVAGDYKIKFNDGVSDYIQEVVLYRSGDTKINDQNAVGAADLVRLIKATKEGVDAAYKCEEWAYDVNGDYVIDTETDSMKNAEVVTLREMILDIYVEDAADKMPIIGFAGPAGNQIKEETYQKIQKLGITLIIENGGEHSYSDIPVNRYYTYEQLTLAQKYGISMTVPDQRLLDMRTESVETIQNYLPEAIEYYKDYQSFAGLFIIDEPVTTSYPPYYLSYTNPNAANFSEYANLAKAVNTMEVNGQKLFAYSNALGYCYQHVNDVTSPYKYMDYLNGFAEEYGNQFVSATYYPFFGEHVDVPDAGSPTDGSDYFKHLALNRYVANESGNPLWTFVQAGDSFELAPDGDPITEGEFKWSANMGLAFGAKGIQYFSLVQPTNPIFHQSPMGLLDSTGAENAAGYYDWAMDVNEELTAIDHILVNATHEGIMTTGTHATEQAANNVKDIELYKSKHWLWATGEDSQGNAKVEVYSNYEGATVTCGTDSTYGTLTGCFKTADGKHALFIANYNPEQDNTVAVNVGSGVAATIIHEGNTTEATGSAYITLGAGEAALVVF
ncbi:MAG: hypothetical protein IJE23_03950 [Tyzzerella sp.]|nr:hypothetical protein [Tyzzerella sp.]